MKKALYIDTCIFLNSARINFNMRAIIEQYNIFVLSSVLEQLKKINRKSRAITLQILKHAKIIKTSAKFDEYVLNLTNTTVWTMDRALKRKFSKKGYILLPRGNHV